MCNLAALSLLQFSASSPLSPFPTSSHTSSDRVVGAYSRTVYIVSMLNPYVNHHNFLSLEFYSLCKEDLGLGVDGFSFHWHFVPVRVETPLRVNPSLENKNRFPQGNYRIRSFSGNYVLTMPQVEKGSPYITKLANNETQKVCCLIMTTFLILIVVNYGSLSSGS